MHVKVTPGMVRSWLCREGDDAPPFTMEDLASAYLLNVQRYAQLLDSIESHSRSYEQSRETLTQSINDMRPDHPQMDEAKRYVGYINTFIQSLDNMIGSCHHAGDWVQEYIKGWKESLDAHRAMYNKNHDALLMEQSQLVRRTDLAFGTLRELRDYRPINQSLESYNKQVKEAASIALQQIEGIRIQ